mmetsp:Transcript_7626/g.12701  ORF Transcript_7626/g.12701 Transcript_7626/m.12701 type:complete len:187 (-) Transcript_7626:240-800(-)
MQTLIFPLFAFSIAVDRASAFQIASGSTPHGHVSHLHLQTRRMGMFDGLMGGKKDDDWKEEAWQAQQEIIRKRKESSGFLSDEDQLEISERRRIVNTEAKALKSVQNGEGADTLEEWKRLREEGVIKTASSGLVRDTDSGRLGSEGLFVERADEKLPYIDSGYVSEEEDFMGGIAKMLGFKKKDKE